MPSGKDRMKELAERLATASRFADAATVVCEQTRCLGVDACVIFLHRASGPPALVVDNFPDIADERRLHCLTKYNWDYNPIFVCIRERLGSIAADQLPNFIRIAREDGYQGADRHPFASPVIGSQGWFATILYGNSIPYTPELERDLAMIATLLSVWCTEHGVGPVPDLPIEGLSRRQYEVAERAAGGETNAEIADAMDISINTVKAHLKFAFQKLGVDNRVELANLMRRLAPPLEVPEGVTHLPTVSITRAPTTAST